MKKLITIILISMLLPVCVFGQSRKSNTAQARNILKGNGNYQPVVLQKLNVTMIEIIDDGYLSPVDLKFSIWVEPEKTTRLAGDPSICGVTNTYFSYDKTLLGKMVNTINAAKLHKTNNKKKLLPTKNGTTTLKVYKGKDVIVELTDSNESTNVQGEFIELVKKLVEMAGGAPDYESVIPEGYYDEENYDDFDTY